MHQWRKRPKERQQACLCVPPASRISNPSKLSAVPRVCLNFIRSRSLHRFIMRHTSPSPPPAGSEDRDSSQPPPAKKLKQKQRGQNKHRPRTRIPYSEQLCPNILHSDAEGRSCRFGEKCRYMHDLSSYLASKPPDIGDHCYLFDKLGRCPYGLACRFGSSHISATHENITNEPVYDASRPSAVRNSLGKELQEKLRKRTLGFPRSDEYLSQLNKEASEKSVTCEESVTCEKSATCDGVKLEEEGGGGVTKEEQPKIGNGDQEVCGQVVVSCITDEGAVRTRLAERNK